jgi:exopolysaccharide biosynthesis protein
MVVDPNDRNYMTKNKLGNILKDLGCTNAYFLDGGGSTNVWIKEQTLTKVRNFRGDRGSRSMMWNIFYWTEL